MLVGSRAPEYLDCINATSRRAAQECGLDPDALEAEAAKNSYDPRKLVKNGPSTLQADEREAIKRFGW